MSMPTIRDFFPEPPNIDPEYATVTAVLSAPPRVRLQLDGSTTAGSKGYKYLASYSPAVGDRVFFVRTSGTIFVIGKIAG